MLYRLTIYSPLTENKMPVELPELPYPADEVTPQPEPMAAWLEAGTLPSTQTGDFCRKGLATRIAQSEAKEALQGMYDSHLANIGSCARALD
jgi:hypothetical protein